jgi:hypothetical protein
MFIANDVKKEHAELTQFLTHQLVEKFGATRIMLSYAISNPDAHRVGEEVTFHTEFAVEGNFADMRDRVAKYWKDHPVV